MPYATVIRCGRDVIVQLSPTVEQALSKAATFALTDDLGDPPESARTNAAIFRTLAYTHQYHEPANDFDIWVVPVAEDV